MKNTIPNYLTALGSLITVAITAQAQYIYTELVYPGIDNAVADGIDGANIVGYYWDNNNVSHGFLYTTTNWNTLDAPGAGKSSSQGTLLFGISGTSIVGYYTDDNGVEHSFLYNTTTTNWTALNDPLAGKGSGQGTDLYALSGSNIVGFYYDSSGVSHGVLYNGSNWFTLNDPGAGNASGQGTLCAGLSEPYISGTFYDSSGNYHGFLYNTITTNWTTRDDPRGTNATFAYGLSGSNVSGSYWDGSSYDAFIYNGSTSNWSKLFDPHAARGQYPNGGCFGHGISGNNVVGSYYTSSSGLKAYVATPIPQLIASQSATNLQISWPYNPFVNWTLQQNPDLTTTNWTPAPTNSISNDGTNNFINITPPTENLFFRLSQK